MKTVKARCITNIICLLLIITGFYAKAQQTYSISGTVSDDKGGPVPGATVFITNSKYVTPTDNTGKFNFDNIRPGSYEVVIKMLGFNPVVHEVTIRERSVNLITRLTESTTTLNTINITAKKNVMPAAERSRYLDMFLANFIGQTVNAEHCKVLNPEIINFDFNRETRLLRATATDFLVIENKALGYKIKYLLTDFEDDLKNITLTYEGYPYFEEMTGTPGEQKKWEENRRLAYLSSEQHFFKALINNTLKEEGFMAYMVTPLVVYNSSLKYKGFSMRDGGSKKLQTVIPLLDSMALFITDHGNYKTIISTPKVVGHDSIFGLITKDTIRGTDTVALKSLYVVYTGEKESPLFYKTGDPASLFPFIKLTNQQKSHRQISQLIPLADTVIVDKNGTLTPSRGFRYSNYWGWQRMADLTPLDYFVEQSVTADSHPQLLKDIKEERPPGLTGVIAAIDTLRSRMPVEKIYLQTDKPYYILGDTLHFKSYLLNADYLTPSTKSGLLYVELDNSNNQMIKRIMVPVKLGMSWGDIALDQEDIPEGSYTLRAYTSWMLNFGEDYVFRKNIYISAIKTSSLLVNAGFRLDSLAGKNEVNASLQFTGLDKNPFRLKDMLFRVVNGKHNLFKYQAATGMDGSVQFHFNLADKTAINDLYIQAQQKSKGADTTTLTIPVTINRPENMDVQFMPEGGALMAGIATKVGFKAISEDGRGAEVSGKIINSKNQEITPVQTLHKGMGSFELTPEANENYTAVITLSNKTTKSYALPKVIPAGTTLRVTAQGDDSLQVTLNNTAISSDTTLRNVNYYLIGQSRGVVCYATAIKFTKQTINKTVAKELFPTGIARFTLLSKNNIPLNERIVYINHNDNLNISVNANKPDYTPRDSVALAIQVRDKDGAPVQGDFSLAVTDNSQVNTDSIGSNVLNNLLFTSDLKGTVEEPGWYFDNPTIKQSDNKIIALDNLLLTQGWMGYDWKQVFTTPTPQLQYQAEKEFAIQGKLTNIFNKPIKQTRVTMLQKQPAWIMETVTNNEGRFVFKERHLLPTDSTYYLIQAKNKDGDNKSFNIGINVDELNPPDFKLTKERLFPWYVNSDTLLLKNASTKIAQMEAEENYKGEGHLLKEVNIKDKKVIPDSHNLNGPGEADVILDEKEMIKARNLTLAELLKQKFPNFNKDPTRGRNIYRLNNHIVVLIIDGIFVARMGFPVDLYMDMLTASEIKGIEIMSTAKFAMAYNPEFLHILMMIPDRFVPVFLEITTYSGHGALLRHVPGRYVYKPIPLSLPKEFYRPRYTIKNSNVAMGTDLRSTIHWQPNVITDADGKAAVSFFSADKAGDYTVIMEGIDLNGNLGYQRKKLKITQGAK